jgi:hypothetical protein
LAARDVIHGLDKESQAALFTKGVKNAQAKKEADVVVLDEEVIIFFCAQTDDVG